MIKVTEKQNPRSKNITQLKTNDILTLINDEDKTVAGKISPLIPTISKIVDSIVYKLNVGGKLFYVGCGTSGRLGVLDAAECPLLLMFIAL